MDDRVRIVEFRFLLPVDEQFKVWTNFVVNFRKDNQIYLELLKTLCLRVVFGLKLHKMVVILINPYKFFNFWSKFWKISIPSGKQ